MKSGLGPNDFEAPSLQALNKVFQVLKSMCNTPVELGGYKYKLAVTKDNGIALVYSAEVTDEKGESEERWFGMDMSLRVFTELCDKLNDDDFTMIVATNTLNQIRKEQIK